MGQIDKIKCDGKINMWLHNEAQNIHNINKSLNNVVMSFTNCSSHFTLNDNLCCKEKVWWPMGNDGAGCDGCDVDTVMWCVSQCTEAGARTITGQECGEGQAPGVSCHSAGSVHQTGRNTGSQARHQPGAQSTGLEEGRLIMIIDWYAYICSLFEVFLLELFDLW